MKKTFARLLDFNDNLAALIVDRILELRPDLIDKQWADLEMASGQFPAEIERRVKNPAEQVKGFELYSRSVKFAVNTRHLLGEYTTQTEMKENMKFDVIIINPWYGKRQWFESAEKARKYLNDDGMLVLVSPDATQNKSNWGSKVKNFFIDNGIQDRWNVTKSFPSVNTGDIGVFFMDLRKSAALKCLSNDSIERSVLDRMIKLTDEVPAFSAVRGRQDIQYKAELFEVKDQSHPHKAFVSVTNDKLVVRYVSDEYAKKQKGFVSGKKILVNRFFGKNNPDPFYIIDDVTGTQLGYGVIAIEVSEHTNDQDQIKLLTHPIYRKIIAHLRGKGMDINQGHFAHLPNFSLSGVEDLNQFLSTQLSLSKREEKYFYE